MPQTQLDDFLRECERTFAPEKAGDADVVLQFTFTGRVEETCHMIISHGTLVTARGPHPAPTLAVTSDFDLFMQVAAYREDGLLAYEDQCYTIAGDPTLLMDADTWFLR